MSKNVQGKSTLAEVSPAELEQFRRIRIVFVGHEDLSKLGLRRPNPDECIYGGTSGEIDSIEAPSGCSGMFIRLKPGSVSRELRESEAPKPAFCSDAPLVLSPDRYVEQSSNGKKRRFASFTADGDEVMRIVFES